MCLPLEYQSVPILVGTSPEDLNAPQSSAYCFSLQTPLRVDVLA
jgi:hypothetical protein